MNNGTNGVKYRDKKVMAKAIGFMMVIMASALMLFVYLVSIIRESKHDAMIDEQSAAFERIYSEMQILRSQSYDNCKAITDDIEADLRALDLDDLKESMDDGIITDEMYAVIEKHIEGVSLNGINNYKNGITVMTNSGVLEDFNYERASDGQIRSWENEIEGAWNKELERDAIDKILIHANKRLIAMEKNYLNEDHIKIPEMTKANLKKVYMAEGMEGLRNYQFKVVCYITESGDIFGQEDIVHGVKQDTHKIIIVQEFNLYDQLQQNSPDVLDSDANLHKIETRYSGILSITYILGLLFTASIIILLFYFSHMYNYYIWAYDNEDPDINKNRKEIINGKGK